MRAANVPHGSRPKINLSFYANGPYHPQVSEHFAEICGATVRRIAPGAANRLLAK